MQPKITWSFTIAFYTFLSLIAIKYFLFIEYEQLLTKFTEKINLNTFFYVVFFILALQYGLDHNEVCYLASSKLKLWADSYSTILVNSLTIRYLSSFSF